MSNLLNIIFLLILITCNSKSIKSSEIKSIDSSIVKSNVQPRETKENDTILLNNKLYLIVHNNYYSYLSSFEGDTIIKGDFNGQFEFLDINLDGYKDIRFRIDYSWIPNECSNYLYDKKTSTYKLLINCYLVLENIKGTDFYYSYERAGCEDSNWESYLSKIENYKLVNYGYMSGQGCELDTINFPQVIDIYKIADEYKDNKKLIQKLPYSKNIPEFGDKWEFIVKYWSENYRIFNKS